MNSNRKVSRREFHRKVGEGMLWAGLGTSLAAELGLSTAFAEQASGNRKLSFGRLEPLVAFMQDTPLEKLQPRVVEKLNKGEVTLEQLMQAAALANARSFGGADYIGMHTLMAMKPAYLMARQLPSDRKALVILKILYRNTAQIHEKGTKHVLHEVDPAELPKGKSSTDALIEAVHGQQNAKAEQILAAIAKRSPEDAFNDLMHVVADDTDVHRIVFAHRSWEILDLAGMENAAAMLRQSLRYCLKSESYSAKRGRPRTVLPKLLDQYKLLSKKAGTRRAETAWIDKFSQTIFGAEPEAAAEAVAEALAEGIAPRDIGEAISLSTNQLILRDAGRPANQTRPGKPEGSVHGDSIGVHASDAAHAWWGIAQVSNHRNAVASLIMSGFQAAWDRTRRGGKFLEWNPRPHEEHLAKIKADNNEALLGELDGAIRAQDQGRACALVHRLGERGGKPRQVIDVLLRYATSEDGALHAEKYFVTATSNFAATRENFRWRHLVGLARVTASEAGRTAAGYSEACELLKVKA
jgi:hypothetical protein